MLQLDFFIQPLDIYSQNKADYPGHYWIFLSNLWLSTAKIKQISQASTGFFQPTFGYLQTNSDICFFCWITLSDLWMSTSRIQQITQASTGFFYGTFGYPQTNSYFTQASTDPLSAICSTNKIDPNIQPVKIRIQANFNKVLEIIKV